MPALRVSYALIDVVDQPVSDPAAARMTPQRH